MHWIFWVLIYLVGIIVSMVLMSLSNDEDLAPWGVVWPITVPLWLLLRGSVKLSDTIVDIIYDWKNRRKNGND